MKDTIKYRENEYPVKTIDIPGYGIRQISTRSLEKALLNPDDTCVDSKAKEVDDSIYFYVPDGMFEKNEEKIASFIFKKVDGEGY